MSEPTAHARLWDRLYVIAAIVLLIFVQAGVALVFQDLIVQWGPAWSETHSSMHPWVGTYIAFHGTSTWMRVLILPLLAWISIVFAFEGRRAAAYARLKEPAPKIPRRVYETTATLHKPLLWAAPLLLLYLASGVLLLFRTQNVEEGTNSVFSALMYLHTRPSADAVLPWLGLFAGQLLCLFLLWIARIRAARLAASGLETAHLYEDFPQGAALGVMSATLVTWIALAWSAPLGSIPVVFLAVSVSVFLSHALPIVATSPMWRFLPFLLVAALMVGDVVHGRAFQSASLQLWGAALVWAFFMVLIARLHRRSLYTSASYARSI